MIRFHRVEGKPITCAVDVQSIILLLIINQYNILLKQINNYNVKLIEKCIKVLKVIHVTVSWLAGVSIHIN